MRHISAYISDGNDLKSVMQSINGEDYTWAIFQLEAMSNDGNENILEFENQINSINEVYIIKWEELLSLIDRLHQIIDIIIVGHENNISIEKFVDIDRINQTYRYVISLEDGDMLDIYSKDMNWLKLLKPTLKNAIVS